MTTKANTSKIKLEEILDGTYDRTRFGKEKLTIVVLKARSIAYALSALKMSEGVADFNPSSESIRKRLQVETYRITDSIVSRERSVDRFMTFAHKKNPFQRAVHDFWVLELLNISFKTDDLPLLTKAVDKLLLDLAISNKHFLSV